MKNIGGIQTPYDTCIVPYKGASDAAGATTKNGIDIPDGQKGVGGEMPEVNEVSLPGEVDNGTKNPPHMKGGIGS